MQLVGSAEVHMLQLQQQTQETFRIGQPAVLYMSGNEALCQPSLLSSPEESCQRWQQELVQDSTDVVVSYTN